MENIIENLYDNILIATVDTNEIENKFKTILGNTICVGSGGSKVVATFLASVLEKKNNGIFTCFEPSSLPKNLSNYENIVACSYSGSNYGVKYALSTKLKSYLFSKRKTKVDKETLIHYEMPDEESFISLGATIIPMAIILKYYLGDDFSYYIEDIFKRIDKQINFSISSFVNVFTSSASTSAMTFLESSLIESGLGVPIINYKYDYCHGRSTINKDHNNSAILFSNGTDLDRKLSEIMEMTMREILIVSSPYDDEIVSDFYFTIQSLYIIECLAKESGVDLKHINYDRIAVKGLYHFKGSM